MAALEDIAILLSVLILFLCQIYALCDRQLISLFWHTILTIKLIGGLRELKRLNIVKYSTNTLIVFPVCFLCKAVTLLNSNIRFVTSQSSVTINGEAQYDINTQLGSFHQACISLLHHAQLSCTDLNSLDAEQILHTRGRVPL